MKIAFCASRAIKKGTLGCPFAIFSMLLSECDDARAPPLDRLSVLATATTVVTTTTFVVMIVVMVMTVTTAAAFAFTVAVTAAAAAFV